MENPIHKQVRDQLKHHVKEKDRARARRSGQEPWFEVFRRLAHEQGCSLANCSVDQLKGRISSLTREKVMSLKRRHDKNEPHSAGCDLPPVIFLDSAGLHLIDGTNRVNRFLSASEDAQAIQVILVAQEYP